MTGFLAVVRHTLSEAFHRKLVLAMFVLIGVELLLVGALIGSASGLITFAGQIVRTRPGGPDALSAILAGLAVVFYYPGLLMMTWLTAGFFPRMQEPGSIDLLLSRPIGRVALLAGRYVGCALLALSAATIFFAGNYLVLGLKTGLWMPAFLLTIPASVFTYLAFLSMMALLSLAGRSTVLVALLTTAYAIFVGPILFAASTAIGKALMGDSAWAGVFAFFYNLLPRTAETGQTLFETIRHGSVASWAPLAQVGASAIAWFAVAAAWFRRKDY